MGYLINAWLEEGAPRLRITDPINGNTTLAWDYPNSSADVESTHKQELQNLFKKLILLACAQNAHSDKTNPRLNSQ